MDEKQHHNRPGLYTQDWNQQNRIRNEIDYDDRRMYDQRQNAGFDPYDPYGEQRRYRNDQNQSQGGNYQQQSQQVSYRPDNDDNRFDMRNMPDWSQYNTSYGKEEHHSGNFGQNHQMGNQHRYQAGSNQTGGSYNQQQTNPYQSPYWTVERKQNPQQGYRSGYNNGFGGAGNTYADNNQGMQGGQYGLNYEGPGYDRDRGWLDRTRDEVTSWFGNKSAERRRRIDHIMEKHRGKGPKDYQRSTDRIREDVCERLTDDDYVDASNIEVKVEGSEVILAGTVRSKDEKRRAEDVVEAISGVRNVENRIRVEQDNDRSGMNLRGMNDSNRSGYDSSPYNDR
jgi:osmotically-inducible protein OsmY